MEFDDAYIDKLIEDEERWRDVDIPFEEDVPSDVDMRSIAPTELDPPSLSQPAPATPVVEQPVDMAVHQEPAASAAVPSEPVAGESDAATSTPVRSHVVSLPQETPSPPVAMPLVVRRRLVCKQRAPAPWMSQVSARYVKCDKPWDVLKATVFGRMNGRQKHIRVWSKCRYWLSVLPFLDTDTKALQDAEPAHMKLLRRANFDFKKLTTQEKHTVLQLFLKDTAAPKHIVEFATIAWPVGNSRDMEPNGYYLYARSVMLTWNGDWGLFADTGLASDVSWRVVVECVRANEAFAALWNEYRVFCERLVASLGAAHFAFCLELCVDTWQEESEVRVHGHMYVSGDSAKLKMARANLAAFKDCNPHKSHKVAALSNRACGGFAGCYYILAPKIGSIKSHSNVRAYKDFGVSAEWITNMVQAEKMTFADARREMTRVGKGYQRRMAELKAWEAGQKEDQLQKHVDAERAYHAATNLEFHKFPEIDAWLERNTRPHLRRKQILVVEGPSGLGKTEYIKSLVGHEACLELNAEAMQHPTLLGLDSTTCKLIFWDECNAELVLRNRKLFQCPPAWISLGFSPTGRDVYNVWVNDLVMAISSNSWTEQLHALERPSDRAWLEQNTVHVHVSEKMWIE